MRIGLPRALLYYYYYPFWKSLFENLGGQVVVSDVSNKKLVEKGIKVTVPEICLPIKIFNAHVLNLMQKELDYIFIPRYLSTSKDKWFCPKIIGLPELVKYTIPAVKDKILMVDVKEGGKKVAKISDLMILCDIFNKTKKELKKAVETSEQVFAKFRDVSKKGFTWPETEQIVFKGAKESDFPHKEGELKIGLLGYVYNIYDTVVSMDIISKLRNMNIKVVTFDMLEEPHALLPKKEKSLYWEFTSRLYLASKRMLDDLNVDGLIHLTAFGCGPDSIVGKYIEIDCEKYNKPFMTIRVDEHTGESHLQTRVEAYIDMLKRRKLPRGHTS